MLLIAAFVAAEIRAEIGAVIHQVVAHKCHIRKLCCGSLQFSRCHICHSRCGTFIGCIVKQLHKLSLLGIVNTEIRCTVGVSGADKNILDGYTGSQIHRGTDPFDEGIIQTQQIRRDQQNRLLTVGHCNTGHINMILDTGAAAGFRVIVAA